MVERRAIVVRGIVQGVGFRPFVYNLAARLQPRRLRQEPDRDRPDRGRRASRRRWTASWPSWPTGRRRWRRSSSCPGSASRRAASAQFRIEPSEADAAGADLHLARRGHLRRLPAPNCSTRPTGAIGYPFLNCTNCGPRLTIITGAPYDRPRTTMAALRDVRRLPGGVRGPGRPPLPRPADRLPGLRPAAASCSTRRASRSRRADPLADFAAALRAGKIGALKGLGGYHLACDAGNAAAVAELRRRKHRDEKPFAVMVADVGGRRSPRARSGRPSARCCCRRAGPIVLLRKRSARRGRRGGRARAIRASA